MYQSSSISMSYFRNRAFTWMILTIFCCSFLPSVSLAQQPTATIKTLSGNVLVSVQAAAVGTVLQAGDTIQTQVGASVVLELSDGSEIHLGENTHVNMADLTQTVTGERVSRLKLLRGWLRAFLSPDHQKEGSSFTVETPNAQVGVKFSQPDVEVSYNPDKQETIGIAHTVELIAINLLTNEKIIVPVGSSVIITAVGIKIIAGIVGAVGASSAGSTGAGTASTGSAGMGTGTKVAIGAGAVAAAGGVAAIATSSGDGGDVSENDESDVSFTGTFVSEFTIQQEGCGEAWFSWSDTLNLTQSEALLTGSYTVIHAIESCCNASCTGSVTGTVDGTTAVLSLSSCEEDCRCPQQSCDYNVRMGGTTTATLTGNGGVLVVADFVNGNSVDFIRQ